MDSKKAGIAVIGVVLLLVLIAVFAADSNNTMGISQKGSSSPVALTGLTRNVTNVDGTIISVPVNITKIGCLYGPSYEKVVILGAEDKVIITSDSSLWPWANVVYRNITKVPTRIQNAQNPNIEQILEDKPDIIFFWNSPAVIRKMQDAGIAVVYPDYPNKFSQSNKEFLIYADALGPDARVKADEYVQYFNEKLAMVSSRTSSIPLEQRPKVYFALQKPLETAGKDTSDISDMIDLAGGKSVTGNLPGGFFTEITMEQLLQWDPDYIVIDHYGTGNAGTEPAGQKFAKMANDTRFSDLTAMKNNHVYFSPTGVFYWDGGQQHILQLMWLAKILHPDKFEDLDMNKEVREFYTKFYRYNLTDDEADRILRSMPPAQPAGK